MAGEGWRQRARQKWGKVGAALADALFHEEGVPCAISPFVVDGPCLFVEEGGEGGYFGEGFISYVASLLTNLADTFASKVGKAYRRMTFFLITTMKLIPRGAEDALFLEGTLASVIVGFLLLV